MTTVRILALLALALLALAIAASNSSLVQLGYVSAYYAALYVLSEVNQTRKAQS